MYRRCCSCLPFYTTAHSNQPECSPNSVRVHAQLCLNDLFTLYEVGHGWVPILFSSVITQGSRRSLLYPVFLTYASTDTLTTPSAYSYASVAGSPTPLLPFSSVPMFLTLTSQTALRAPCVSALCVPQTAYPHFVRRCAVAPSLHRVGYRTVFWSFLRYSRPGQLPTSCPSATQESSIRFFLLERSTSFHSRFSQITSQTASGLRSRRSRVGNFGYSERGLALRSPLKKLEANEKYLSEDNDIITFQAETDLLRWPVHSLFDRDVLHL